MIINMFIRYHSAFYTQVHVTTVAPAEPCHIATCMSGIAQAFCCFFRHMRCSFFIHFAAYKYMYSSFFCFFSNQTVKTRHYGTSAPTNLDDRRLCLRDISISSAQRLHVRLYVESTTFDVTSTRRALNVVSAHAYCTACCTA